MGVERKGRRDVPTPNKSVGPCVLIVHKVYLVLLRPDPFCNMAYPKSKNNHRPFPVCRWRWISLRVLGWRVVPVLYVYLTWGVSWDTCPTTFRLYFSSVRFLLFTETGWRHNTSLGTCRLSDKTKFLTDKEKQEGNRETKEPTLTRATHLTGTGRWSQSSRTQSTVETSSNRRRGRGTLSVPSPEILETRWHMYLPT